MPVEQVEILPTLPRLRRTPLRTARDLLREHRRLYLEARYGQLPLADACRLSFLLSNIAKVHEIAELEARVQALETDAGATPTNRGA